MDVSRILKYASFFLFSIAGTWQSDQLDLIRSFNKNDVKYVVIGGGALELFGIRDSSGDIDVYIETSPENSFKTYKALAEFGVPLRSMGVTPHTFCESEEGPPQNLRIGSFGEILTHVTGMPMDFQTAFANKSVIELKGVKINALTPQGIADMKRSTQRSKDLEDLKLLKTKGIKPSKVK